MNYALTLTSKVTQGYGPKHTGIDYKASVGTPIPSPVTGTIVRTGNGRKDGNTDLGWDYGNWIVVQDLAGAFHFFAHLSSISLPMGAPVRVNEIIGLSGRTGNVTGPHIHWAVFRELWHRASLTNPVAYIQSMLGSEDYTTQVRRVSAYLNRVLAPKYYSSAVITGKPGYYYWVMVQRWGKNSKLYTGPVNGIPGVNSRRVESHLITITKG